MAGLTVRQVGQVAPPLKQKIEQFQQIIDNNDQSVARIREQLRRLEPQRERLSDQVQQRQDDGRSIHSQLVRLEDSLASFGAESVQLEAAAEEMPRLLERIAVPVNGPGPGDPSFRRLPAAAIDVPLPYFDTLAEQLEARTKQIYERVNAVEKALATYNRQVSGVPVTSQIEAVVRSEFLQFKAIAAELTQD
ncbi:npp-10 [Symbiodinium natans]|uniref:Npp-10 protein n=1 Tax=Symbiodinium natans TaxID=878477 RepID=A0A812TRG4_9DINO|nr:npp-10 [Symbiodinium natans]